jgi:hypothetical protein
LSQSVFHMSLWLVSDPKQHSFFLETIREIIILDKKILRTNSMFSIIYSLIFYCALFLYMCKN